MTGFILGFIAGAVFVLAAGLISIGWALADADEFEREHAE